MSIRLCSYCTYCIKFSMWNSHRLFPPPPSFVINSHKWWGWRVGPSELELLLKSLRLTEVCLVLQDSKWNLSGFYMKCMSQVLPVADFICTYNRQIFYRAQITLSLPCQYISLV
uniref:Uncharacterized protein n=1 Tax=Sphaerodactylus townsendi TaxID=933632 RepID=A0ACB8ENM0_9SAUR